MLKAYVITETKRTLHNYPFMENTTGIVSK